MLNRDGREKTVVATLLATPDSKTFADAGNELLKNLGMELENLSASEKAILKIPGGVKVTRITNGIISRQTNMQDGFIITRVNRTAVNSKEDFIRELKDKKGGILLEGIYPSVPAVYYYAFGL